MLHGPGFPVEFLSYASDILAETMHGLSGGEIVKLTVGYASKYGVSLPHPSYPFMAGNKRTALYENILAFAPPVQYAILLGMCDRTRPGAPPRPEVQRLRRELVTKFGHLNPRDQPSHVNETLVEETRHFLAPYPAALQSFRSALEKYELKTFSRNLIDDLRLALEQLLRQLLGNSKSLENQLSGVGELLKNSGGSPHLQNMLVKLIDYYTKYNNEHAKHGDSVAEHEIEFLIEVTAAFMKHLVRIAQA